MQLDKILNEPKSQAIDTFAIQVNLKDHKIFSKFCFYAFFGNFEARFKSELYF